jgi:hypothetical protein
MAQTLSTYDALLKEFYEGTARETLNNDVPLFKELDESDRAWSGRRVIFPFHTARNSGIGARAENGTLPTAGNQGTLQSVISSTYNYARIQLTGQVLHSGPNVFAEALGFEMEGAMNDLKVDCARQTWGMGDGRIAQVGADAAASSQISLYNRFAEPGQPGARYLSVGQSIDLGSLADPDQDGASESISLVSISQDAGTTVDTVTTVATNTTSQCDTFVFNAGAGGAGVEMMGVQALVDVYTQANMWGSNAFYGSAVQGINRAANSAFDALVLGNGGVKRVLDGILIQTALDRIHEETGHEADLIMGHHTVVRKFLDSVSSDRRYGSPVFDAGFDKLSYNGIPIRRDRLAPYNSLLVMKKEALKMYTLQDLEWAADDGNILKPVADTDAYNAYLRIYRNLGLDKNPKLACMIRDIDTD